MINELKELLALVEKLPDMVLWVLLGFAIYKVVIYLSSVGAGVVIAKLLIEKLHNAITNNIDKKHDFLIKKLGKHD